MVYFNFSEYKGNDMLKKIIILYLFSFNSLMADNTTSFKFESGIEKNTLIELYTSEGCSSCPPAEAYLNRLKNNNKLWSKYIPIALHVDYWDYIGWKDPYATKENGQRQSRYASLKRASTVYTPAFMVNGSSWRRGIFSNSLPNESSIVGNLVVNINGHEVKASYKNKINTPLKLNVAILGMDLTSVIEQGENAGRTAKHEFVVVGFNSSNSSNLSWNMELPKLNYTKSKKYALAVWVSEVNNPTPLQAVGGYLTNFKY